jgi:hypothetical protein
VDSYLQYTEARLEIAQYGVVVMVEEFRAGNLARADV